MPADTRASDLVMQCSPINNSGSSASHPMDSTRLVVSGPKRAGGSLTSAALADSYSGRRDSGGSRIRIYLAV
jgi:hypothetical protein